MDALLGPGRLGSSKIGGLTVRALPPSRFPARRMRRSSALHTAQNSADLAAARGARCRECVGLYLAHEGSTFLSHQT